MLTMLTSNADFVWDSLRNFAGSTGIAGFFSEMGWGSVAMICVAFFLLYLAIRHKFEPLLLFTIAFGMLLTNLPGANLYHTELFADGHVHWDIFVANAGLLDYLYLGVKLGIYPCLIFVGVGAMTDFGPLIANPKSFLLGAAAQIGIFATFLGAYALGFTPAQAGSIGIIGGADGPTAIYLTSMLAPELLGPIAVAAYSYMALVPVIQPPIMRALTTEKERKIAQEVVKEIRERLRFLMDVGLGYLSLSRSSRSLSGGESQRIRLATQIGSKLVNVLYILDEPSIGLHQRDNRRLIRSLEELRDAGNSVIVVEHDEDMMRAADFIVDVGPRAGRKGGHIMAAGTIDDILRSDSITADYLTGRRRIGIPETLRKGTGQCIVIRGARGNNLKNVTAEFPLGKFICVTGVSGSGKSTLVNETLRPILSKELYRSFGQPLEYDSVEGIGHIDKLVVVDQSPIGRTPRSNPATYSNVFSDIRKLFEMTPDAQIRGFKAGRFSFNVKGGRCEECRGAGVQTIEMNFLPDVYVRCKACGGHRYNRETLEVKYKGKNIDDVLNMTVNMAVEFFENIPNIYQKLRAIQEVGLGYLTLGQPCTTLSGGESQRIKLSSELSKRDTGRTLYILDEPTTGLHFEDIRLLLEVLNKLVDRGNTVIVIEHNLDVIKVADHIIDIGPEGGAAGGEIIAAGTPHEVAQCEGSYTGQFLKKLGL